MLVEKPTPLYTARKLSISIGTSRYDSQTQHVSLTWAAFVERMRKPEYGDETQADYFELSKAKQDDLKDVGWVIGGKFSGRRRTKGELEFRDIIALDVDHGDPDIIARIEVALMGYEFLLHTTRKHTPDKPRVRIYLPLQTEIVPEKYAPIARYIANIVGIDYFDETTDQPQRLMYMPSVCADGQYVFVHEQGEWFNPDEILAKYDDWRDATQWPTSKQHLRVATPSGRKARDPREKDGHVGAFCRTYDIHSAIAEFLPEVYTQTIDDRYTYNAGTTANGAVTYDGLFMYSNHESDPAGQQLCNAFDLVRLHKFGALDETAKDDTPVPKLPSSTEMRKFAGSLDAVKADMIRADMVGFEAVPTEDVMWFSQFALTERGDRKSSVANTLLVLEHDPKLAGFRTNELLGATVRRGPLPWAPDVKDMRNGDRWTDDDEVELRRYLENAWELEIGTERAFQAVRAVANDRGFHPVREYLNSLIWDGTNRLDRLLVDYLGADDNPYTRAVGRKAMIAAVRRAQRPGCKFDHVLILEGRQGAGKSSFIRALSPDPLWFADSINMDSEKEAIEQMGGKWLIEVPEMRAATKQDVNHLKSFVTRQSDRARLAYGRNVTEAPRQSIMIGTTNEGGYLRDETGNRRFWPVKCGVERVDVDAVAEARDQLWAEAVFREMMGEELWLDDPVVAALANAEQAARHVDDGWCGVIEEWLDQPVETTPDEADDVAGLIGKRDRTCITEIAERCFDIRRASIAPKTRDRIKQIMDEMDGWERAGKTIRVGNYGPQKGWIRCNREGVTGPKSVTGVV